MNNRIAHRIQNIGVWAYPWDLLAEPDPMGRHLEMGLSYVCVAARYHAVRALAFRGDQPYISTYRSTQNLLLTAVQVAERYQSRDLTVDAWIVCFHEDPAPEEEMVINCFGNTYPWTSCPRHPGAADRVLSFVQAVADSGAFRTLELEAFGFYGLAHGSEHDKLSLPPSPGIAELLSFCCCKRCRKASGIEPAEIAETTRGLLLGTNAVDPDRVATILALEAEARRNYRDALVMEARARTRGKARLRLQVSPDPHAMGAAGPVPGSTDGWPDEVLVPNWSAPSSAGGANLAHLMQVSPVPVIAGLALVPPYCSEADICATVENIAHLRPAGVCAYHDGLMTPTARSAYAKSLRSL